MDKELCFLINDDRLYLEHVLVEYSFVPIFFLCKGEKGYYVVLCTDMDELIYVVTEISNMNLYLLLHGKIPMRDVILEQEYYWEVISGNEVENDIAVRKEIKQLDKDSLPEEYAVFEILTEDIEQYVQEFDKQFLSAQYSFVKSYTAILSNKSYHLSEKRMARNKLMYNIDKWQKNTAGDILEEQDPMEDKRNISESLIKSVTVAG